MAEKKVIELEVKTESVGNLKAELRKAQAEVTALAEKFGATSQEAINAAKKAAELKDAIADAKALTDAYNPDAKFNALASSIGGVLNGFQAFEGALGLVGVESENVQKALLQVQSAMALTQGINGVLEAKEDFARLGKQISDVYSDAIKGFKGMTAAGKAFAVTGIGLLITGLGLVITYWDDIKAAISGVSAEQEALNIKSQKDVDLQNEKLDALGSQDNILKLQGLTEKQILQLKIKQTDQAIKAYEISIQNQENTLKAQIQAEKKNKEILKGILQFILAPINLLLKTIDEIGAFLGKDWDLQDQVMDWTASLIFDPKEVEDEGMKAINEQKKALAKLKNDRAGYELQIQAIDKEAADKRAEAAKTAREKRKAELDKEAEDRKKAAEDKAKFELEQIELDETRAEQAWARKQEEQAKMLEEELALEEAARQRRQEAEALEEQRQIEAFEREKELRLRNKEFALQSAQDTFSIITNLASQTQQKYEKLNQAVLDNDKLTDKEKQKLLDENNKRAKKAFEVQKAVSIASALVATYQSAVSAYQSQFLPLPDPSSPIRGAIAAGLAVAAGLANVKNIASQKFEGASLTPSSGGVGGSVPDIAGSTSAITPNFNIVGNAQATNPLAGLGGQPLQAYVVSGEVTTAQSLDRNRVNYATFG